MKFDNCEKHGYVEHIQSNNTDEYSCIDCINTELNKYKIYPDYSILEINNLII